MECVRGEFERLGYSVDVNYPFRGSLAPSDYYSKDARVQSVMIEVNRALYMDEKTGEKGDHFAQVQEQLSSVLEAIGKYADGGRE